MLRLNNIYASIGGQQLLQEISCSMQPGSITVLLGPSGAGKTTLLRVIAQLIRPDTGNITLSNQQLATLQGPERVQTVGLVTQAFALFPQLTVLEQCTNPLINVLKLSKQEAAIKTAAILVRFGMERYANNYPSQLSGGQQQRVALARLLCMDPAIILLDEPTSALDPANTALVAEMLRELAQQNKIVVLSTQDMTLAEQVCDQALFLRNGTIVDTAKNNIIQRMKSVCNQT